MKSWRGKKRRTYSINQPFLPGLFSAKKQTNKHFKRPTSPGDFALEKARARLSIIFICFALFFTVACVKLTIVSIGKEKQQTHSLKALSNNIKISSRANIVDRNGVILATSLPTIMLMADTHNIMNVNKAAIKIKTVLKNINIKKLKKKLSSKKRYKVIKRHITPKQYYKINKLGIAGLEYVPDESRIYPAGSIVSHIIGYTDTDNNGIAGLEKTENSFLQKSNEDLVTSIDIKLQTILHRELKKALKEYKAIGATGIIIDIKTGEILSLVSLPDFKPQDAGVASNNSKFNRATLGVYEMGSTFKIFNTALALDSCSIRPKQRFDTTKAIRIGGQTIRDMHPAKHWMNVAEIFIKSSNVGSARMARLCGKEKQQAFLKKLGITNKLKLEIPEIGAPIVPSKKRWGDTATMTISYGHGIAINAVQLVAASAGLLNGGYKIAPTLLKETDATHSFSKKNRIISKNTSKKLQGLMRLVVRYGTGKKAKVNGYLVGGKTGTADKAKNRRYNRNSRISSFLGVFPSNSPRYIVFALLDNPKGTKKTFGYATGGWTAAPVVGKVIGQIGPLLNIPPVEKDVITAMEKRIIRPLGRNILDTIGLKKETDNYAAIESNNPH